MISLAVTGWEAGPGRGSCSTWQGRKMPWPSLIASALPTVCRIDATSCLDCYPIKHEL